MSIGSAHLKLSEIYSSLYSRAKQIVWSNPVYKDVIVMMGGFHIAANFLKAIGQHMQNAGLDDIWAESSLFAQNSIPSILEGKAYY